MTKSWRFAMALLVAVAMLLAACSGDDGGESKSESDAESGSTTSAQAADPEDTGIAEYPDEEAVVVADGFVDEEWFQGRADDYLEFATAELNPSSINNVIAHAARASRDPSFSWDAESVTVDSFQPIFDEIDALKDTTDFDLMYLMNLWYGYRDQLDPELVSAIEERFLGFRYWYTEPLEEDVLDHKWFWSENHRIIFHVIEYLAGQAFPDGVFRDGQTGAQHMTHAEPLIRAWVEERADYGFSEWHSNVYMQKNVVPLLTLAEWVEDEELRTLASMVLDVALYDIGSHTQAGAYGATHGRSYKKDKNTALDEDTWGIQKLLFDDTEYPYQSTSDAGATHLAISEQYRLPEAIRGVAVSDEVSVARERHGVPLDATAPLEDDPVPPYGIAFDDPKNVAFWWSMGALTPWQTVPLTIVTADEYRLWETDLWQDYGSLRDAVGGDPEAGRQLAAGIGEMASFGLLPEVNTYTWRAPEAMLSTAQDHRPGQNAEQVHAWQATLDANAQVFTTHPSRPNPESTEWREDPGYWTGTASMPRSAQHEQAAIHIYAPQYESQDPDGPLGLFRYEPYTHAYFPQDHFDEVTSEGNWTFGRLGDGYVALWSWRTPEFRSYDPAVVATNGMVEAFDLVAEGGPDNVWIVEVGRAADHGSFEEFTAAVTSAEVSATPRAEGDPSAGFDVRYVSPGVGEMAFVWDGPLTVDGQEVAISDYPRVDSPWATVEHLNRAFAVSAGGTEVSLDFDSATRETR